MIMSGMFYSFEEAAEKLKRDKEEIKKLVRDGKLREFRDGPNVLFKVSEVEALMPDVEVPEPSESEELIELEPEMEVSEQVEEPVQESVPEESSGEAALEGEPLELEPEMDTSEPADEISEEVSSEESSEKNLSEDELFELEPESEPEEVSSESNDFPDFDMETSVSEVPEEVFEEVEPAKDEEDENLDSILLAPETGAPAEDLDLSAGDTALTGQGTSILGLTDNKEYDLTDDTMADTVVFDATKGGSSAEGLDEIEEDVNLDSFGSGSGLLDLSLQADDTSLGGILDEIYTDESTEPAAGPEPDLHADIAAGQEEMVPEEVSLTPQIETGLTVPLGPAVTQAAPDSQSNILGIVLFIPIIAVLYAAIVAISGTRGILPSILTAIQIWVWPIMGVLGAVSLIIVVAAFMLTGEKKARVPKEKKVKAPKVKKEKVKKPKKEKKPKEKKAK